MNPPAVDAVPVAGGSASRGRPTLADADFDRLREFVYRRTGIQFTPAKRYFVDKRVHAMVAESGAEDFASWFGRLRIGEEGLFQRLVNELTVNETYFLREDHQFDALVGTVLSQVLADRRAAGTDRQPLRILSLPCSTGEEPYSIALRIVEEWPEIDDVEVSVVAGDIDTRVLAAARAGVYGARSLARVPRAWLARWFVPLGNDSFRLSDDLRQAVDFRLMNLADPAVVAQNAPFDVVFCRNLLIYFDEVSSRLAAQHLFGLLRPGGYLFLGHSESMSRISPIFTPRRLPEGIVYQRPHPGERR